MKLRIQTFVFYISDCTYNPLKFFQYLLCTPCTQQYLLVRFIFARLVPFLFCLVPFMFSFVQKIISSTNIRVAEKYIVSQIIIGWQWESDTECVIYFAMTCTLLKSFLHSKSCMQHCRCLLTGSSHLSTYWHRLV